MSETEKSGFIKVFQKAEERRAKSRFDEAIALYIKAKGLCGKDNEARLSCLLALGDCYRMTGMYDKAGKSYEKAHKIAKTSSPASAPDALVGKGLTLRAMGNHREALKIFSKCQQLYEISGDKAGVAFSLWAKGGAYRIKGDLKKTIETFKRALNLFNVLKDKSGIGYSFCGLGGALRVSGRFDDSYRFYSKANRIFIRLKDTFGIAYSYCGIANARRMKGDFKDSLKYFKEAKSYYKKIGDRVSFAYTLWGEGTALKMMGNLRNAELDFRKAQKLFKLTEDERGLSYCGLSMAELNFLRGKPHRAIPLFKAALKRAKRFSFGVEIKYAKRFLHAAREGRGFPINLP